MATKFFNNTDGNTLFEKLKGIATEMAHFDQFLAVVGFFRSSGYFKLRRELGDVKKIKILVGINIDDIFRRHNKMLLMLTDGTEAKDIFEQSFRQDVVDARYAPEVEKGILQLCQDIVDGRLEMRIHDQRNLHAKFYLCLPDHYTPNTDGRVIMGSSNISEAGLGITMPPRYELNVALRDYDDVNYCKGEFEQLWERSIPLSAEDIKHFKRKTHLDYVPTPYELYIKVLIEAFGDQVEDDFFIQLPRGVKDLKYQRDAVIQGYQIMMHHNGVFLADVVGLGKTLIATMIAKRFIEANGRDTRILVIYPPALEEAWKQTFKLFEIAQRADFITNGSLKKVLDCTSNYREKEEYHLVIVDEAHGFRSDYSNKYDELQKICKSPCTRPGLLNLQQKRVMLLSATPLNNRPEDLLNQLLLFQNAQHCTIDGVPNLRLFFTPLLEQYHKLITQRNQGVQGEFTQAVDKLYEKIRTTVIDKVTVRRTRSNIMSDKDYRADLKAQGITFPAIAPPLDIEYQLDEDTSKRFYQTLDVLCNEEADPHLLYARYRAIAFLKPELRAKYKNAGQIAQSLSSIYRVHMVKRLESSFFAFKKSLGTLLRITNDMIHMFEADKVLIIPDMDVKGLMGKGLELDEVISYALEKGKAESDIVFHAEDFSPEFLKMLQHDSQVLSFLCEEWKKEDSDPKFDEFIRRLKSDFFAPDRNVGGKLVVFSESLDTVTYLYKRLPEELGRTDVLMVTAANRQRLAQVIKHNFDANDPVKENRYNVILTTDVLAEGINLHRANVIVNYDSPWNATRLMQRIGRVNRIGSVADTIYNYLFYPSQQGDKEIQLYKNALIKLQGFHSAFGEDAQIYSREEIVRQFELYDNHVKDSVDERIRLLREVRDIYQQDRPLYHKIKRLALKSRVMRQTGHHAGQTIVFVKSPVKTEFYLVKGDAAPTPIDFLTAARIFKAQPDELGYPVPSDSPHFRQVERALNAYATSHTEATDTTSINRPELDKRSQEANKFLRTVSQLTTDSVLRENCATLTRYVEEGIFSQLRVKLSRMARQYKGDRGRIRADEYQLQIQLADIVSSYGTAHSNRLHETVLNDEPRVVVSETFG